jgi:hypothetical protein
MHRRSIVEQLSAIPSSLPSLHDEMGIVFRAGDCHPKNYHAWTYARYIWQHLWLYQSSEIQLQLSQLNESIQSWCNAHVSDHSGWMFYLWYWGGDRPWRERLMEFEKPIDVVKQVLKRGTHVTPGHEALWAFVRGSVIGMEDVLSGEQKGTILKDVAFYGEELKQMKEPTVADIKNLHAISHILRFNCKMKALRENIEEQNLVETSGSI